MFLEIAHYLSTNQPKTNSLPKIVVEIQMQLHTPKTQDHTIQNKESTHNQARKNQSNKQMKHQSNK